MGLLGSIDDYLIEYGPSAAIGGGLGFLVGGPAGALIGATTAVAGQELGPRAAAALPEGTPKELRTLTEYGVYGALSGPNVGAALARKAGAKIALQAAMSRAASREGAKLAVGSGLGAVVGQKVVGDVLGGPDWLGEIGGSIAGPVAPGIGRRLASDFLETRAVAYQSGNPRWKGLAEAFGANEVNSAKAARTPPEAVDGIKLYGSSADAAARARTQAEYLRQRALTLKERLDDDEIRALTGLTTENPRAYLLARAKNQMPPELGGDAGPMTKELIKGKRRLQSLNTQLRRAIERDEEAQSAFANIKAQMASTVRRSVRPTTTDGFYLEEPGVPKIGPFSSRDEAATYYSYLHNAGLDQGSRYVGQYTADDIARAETAAVAPDEQLLQQTQSHLNWGSGDGLPDGEMVPFGQGPDGKPTGWAWRSADGTETLVPDEIAERFNAADAAVKTVRTARERAEASMKTLLGVEELPEDEAARLAVLREKVLGPDLARVDEELMPPEQAQELARTVLSRDAEFKADALRRKGALEDDALRHEQFADFIEQNPRYGALAPQKMAQATRDYAAIRQQEDLLKAAGAARRRFVDIPDESVLELSDYAGIVEYIAKAQPTPDRATSTLTRLLIDQLQDGAEGQIGSVWLKGEAGTLQPRRLVGLDAASGTALVRTDFQSAGQADAVPLNQLVLRFTPDQHSALNTEILAARRMGGGSTRNLPKPQIASTRRLWSTRKDYDEAVARATREGRPIPVADGIVEENLQAGWARFEENFMPAGNILESKNLTPEYNEAQMRGLRNIMSIRPRKGASPTELADFVDFQRNIRTNVTALEGERFPVDVRDLADEYGIQLGGVDPKAPFINLMVQSDSDVVNLARKGTTGFKGAVGQAIERYGAGISVRSDFGKSILQHFFGVRENAALYTAGTFGAARTDLANALARRFNLKGFDPLSKDGRLTQLLITNFDPEGLKNVPNIGDDLYRRFQALPDAAKPVFVEKFAPRIEHLLQYPEAFPKLAGLPEVNLTRLNWNFYTEAIEQQSRILGVGAMTHARKFSMIVDKDAKKFLNPDVLAAKGTTKREPNFFDVFDMIWEGKQGDAQAVRKAIITGAEADMAGPMAAFESMDERVLERKIRLAAKDPSKVTNDDLRFDSRGWTIKNLNKWPSELHDDLQAIVAIGSGRHQWEGLQKLSQKVALGALALDLSVVGVQGFKYAAHSLLAGRPFRAARILSEGLTHVTTDYGFNTFVRQNMDELMYYSRLGLTGGLRGQIAGPELNKTALENLPFVGGVFGKLYGLSDIQYGRAVYFWKVQAIRDNLETIRMLRAARGQVADKFLEDVIESSPTLKAMRDEHGGFEAFMLGTNEDTVAQTVRQVQRGFSSVNLAAEGVGPTRQALEQIFTIVPGFFRGQAGQWAAAVTKPHTLEGHLALSMLAREYMFGGMLALGFARLFGTEERINWDDMSSGTWLGVPLPESMGGGTVTLLPTMGIPRLASRVIRDTAEGAATGEVPDIDRSLEAFAHGRLSPLVGAFYDGIKGEDFLGRKYDSELERWGFALTSTLPIVMQSAIEDSVEEYKHSQATGDFNFKDLAISSGLEILGKGLIPKHPSEQLNTIAQSAFETDWQLLTDAEKAELRRSNPAVAVAEAEYDYWTSRRAGSTESFIDRQFKDYSATVDSIWNEPRTIDGIRSTQADDDQRILDGSMSGDTWRQRYHMRQQAAAQEYESLQRRLSFEGVDIAQARADRLARLAENRPEDRAVLLQLAKAEYSSVDPPTELRTVATPVGEVTVEAVNWDAFYTEREAILNEYPTEVREAVRRSARAEELPGVAAYQQASALQREIESLGRYRGLSPEQGDKLDRMRAVISAVSDTIRGQAGAASGSVPRSVIEQAATQQLRTSGLLTSNSDLELLTLAFAMGRDEVLAEALRNPAQVSAILSNPEVAIWYPYLRYRVPQALWPQLPAQVFQAELIEAQLAAAF